MIGESWFAVEYAWRPEPSQTSHVQPEPKRVTPFCVIVSLRASTPPNVVADRVGERAGGLAAAVGLMTCQKSEWFACPPALLRTAACLSSGRSPSVREHVLDGRVRPLACRRAPCSRCRRRPGDACRGGSPSSSRRCAARGRRGRKAEREARRPSWSPLSAVPAILESLACARFSSSDETGRRGAPRPGRLPGRGRARARRDRARRSPSPAADDRPAAGRRDADRAHAHASRRRRADVRAEDRRRRPEQLRARARSAPGHGDAVRRRDGPDDRRRERVADHRDSDGCGERSRDAGAGARGRARARDRRHRPPGEALISACSCRRCSRAAKEVLMVRVGG